MESIVLVSLFPRSYCSGAYQLMGKCLGDELRCSNRIGSFRQVGLERSRLYCHLDEDEG